MKKEINGIYVELRKGDITQQKDCKAVVNAANAMLQSGGGVAGAIHRAAGPELAREATKMAPIKPGEAVITKAYGLPNEYVIHCLGPVYGQDKPEDQLLKSCYDRAIDLAEEKQLESMAFPAISTGVFAFPVQKAAQVALETIWNRTAKLKYLKTIAMVLHNEKDLEIHKNVLRNISENR